MSSVAALWSGPCIQTHWSYAVNEIFAHKHNDVDTNISDNELIMFITKSTGALITRVE